ncbi:hypothetical protein ISCGN_007142 [Ixodes scapularis]
MHKSVVPDTKLLDSPGIHGTLQLELGALSGSDLPVPLASILARFHEGACRRRSHKARRTSRRTDRNQSKTKNEPALTDSESKGRCAAGGAKLRQRAASIELRHEIRPPSDTHLGGTSGTGL